MRNVDQQLRNLPRLRPSEKLGLELRILASKERARTLRYRDLPSTVRYLRQRVSLHLDNLMRPLAVPALGGVVTALALFLMLTSAYPVRPVHAASFDVPTRLSTTASLKTMASYTTVSTPVTVLVQVNSEGRVVAYQIRDGASAMQNDSVRRNVEQILLFTVFTPATNFGKPVSALVTISLGHNNNVLVLG
ncbi:MAG: hypothetical protein MUF01_16395 [Bryobacterales bacterium]|jgi:hypothetical protein|nr:hypothetical protein [Bryobacterales bacterium]